MMERGVSGSVSQAMTTGLKVDDGVGAGWAVTKLELFWDRPSLMKMMRRIDT